MAHNPARIGLGRTSRLRTLHAVSLEFCNSFSLGRNQTPKWARLMEFLQHCSTRAKHKVFANTKVAYKPNPLKLVRVKSGGRSRSISDPCTLWTGKKTSEHNRKNGGFNTKTLHWRKFTKNYDTGKTTENSKDFIFYIQIPNSSRVVCCRTKKSLQDTAPKKNNGLGAILGKFCSLLLLLFGEFKFI